MRLSIASSARLAVAAAAVLSTAVVGSAAALGSTPGQVSSASDPGTLIVHPVADHIRAGFMAPVPFSDAQCEATFQIDCFVPDQVEAAYNLPALYNRGITGRGRTIVVVDAFGSPTIADDLLQFDQSQGLGIGTPSLRIVKVGNVPAFDSGNADMIGWANETTLDVEYSHAGAPAAKIVLVEVAKEDLQHLALGVRYAVQHKLGDVISLSWGEPEQALGRKLVSSDSSIFSQAARSHITIVASSGDSGACTRVIASRKLGHFRCARSDGSIHSGKSSNWRNAPFTARPSSRFVTPAVRGQTGSISGISPALATGST